MEALEIKPNVVHSNEWQAGLIPLYMRTFYKDYFDGIANVQSIHNLSYKGVFDDHDGRYFRKIASVGASSALERQEDTLAPYIETCLQWPGHSGVISLIRPGIVLSDKVHTVGITYVEELLTMPEVSGELREDLQKRADGGDLIGILNGIDPAQYNPETDNTIAHKYGIETVAQGKQKNQEAFLGLASGEGKNKFVIGFVGRLSHLKGMDLILKSIEELAAEKDTEIIILGIDVEEYTDQLRAVEAEYPNVRVYPEFNGKTKQVYAVSDIVLVPSAKGTDPYNLVQAEARRYGAIPVVFDTGGLHDLTKPFSQVGDEAEGANGFMFNEYIPEALQRVVTQAHTLYREQPDTFHQLRVNAMGTDSSWDQQTSAYKNLYADAAAEAKAMPVVQAEPIQLAEVPGLIKEVEQDISARESFDLISPKIAALVETARENIDDETAVMLIRDILTRIMRNRVNSIDIREQAILGVRFLADAETIVTFGEIEADNITIAKALKLSTDHSRAAFNLYGDRSATTDRTAFVIYSDVLEQSEGAREAIRHAASLGMPAPYLVIRNQRINRIDVDNYLSKLGLRVDMFTRVSMIGDYMEVFPDTIIDKPFLEAAMNNLVADLASQLRDFSTIRLVAIGDASLLAPWHVYAGRVLAMLFNRAVSDQLGAGTYIELQNGKTTEIDEYKRYESIIAEYA